MILRWLSSAVGFENFEESKKFGLLATIFGLIIAVYWALRPIKDSLFNAIVGMDYQPVAKWVSMALIVPLVLIYSKLIDKYPRQIVFYGLTALYGAVALLFAYFFMHPTIGLANTEKDVWRIIGWLWYVFVESYGSLIVALFWAFTADITAPEQAPRGFPVIAMLGQFGNIVGPYFLAAKKLGFTNSAPVVGICGVLTLFIGFMLYVFMQVVPKSQLAGYGAPAAHDEKHAEPGFFEGLRLLLTQGYLMGIFLIITIYEIIVTILDYHFKTSAAAIYTAEVDLAEYLSSYAVWVGIIAFACIICKINKIQEKLGMAASLILLPILVTVAVATIWYYPSWLTASFWIMVFSKAVNYALNQPSMKQLYIPTTKDTKYKAQAWIEMFGSRGAKAGGSFVNNFRRTFTASKGAAAGVSSFLTMVLGVSVGLVAVWLFVALYVARTYNKAIDENKVVC